MQRGIAVLFSVLFTMSVFATENLTNVEEDLFWIQQQEIQNRQLTTDQVRALNQELITNLANEEITARRVGRRVPTVTRRQAGQVLQALQADPVASTNALPQYDPSKQMGFCFGRATWVHLELLRRGVQKESIRKIFVVGSMHQNWRYHVATIVRADNGEWLVIDPEVFQVVTLQQWYDTMWRWSADQKMRAYVTDARKFGPSNPEYTSRALRDPAYNEFFTNMFRYFHENPTSEADSFKSETDHGASNPRPERNNRGGGVIGMCTRIFKAVTGRGRR